MNEPKDRFVIDSIEKALAVDTALKEYLQRLADEDTDPAMKAAIEKQLASWDRCDGPCSGYLRSD